jgi:hypothetical protein
MRVSHLSAALLVALGLSWSSATLASETRIPDSVVKDATALRDRALQDNTSWKIVESLTSEVGPRLAGSEGDARAVAWAKAKFKALGYDKVWTQDVTFPKWERRSEHGEVLGRSSQELKLTALGGSPGGTVQGEVVRFDDLKALQAVKPGSLKGKIVFVDILMPRARDGHGYGIGSTVRRAGPPAAARAGAVGYVMRPAGTDWHRNPHTGMTRFDDQTPIPSASLTNNDADQLARLVALGKTEIKVALDCGFNGMYTSQNVIGEITGTTKPDEIVALGGHLDSWDLGTGAIDDGGGVALTMAVGHLIKQMKIKPVRTIRVVAFANEEQGLFGGRVYTESQQNDIRKHQMVMESDSGPGMIYAFGGNWAPEAGAAVKQMYDVIAPLGIAYEPLKGSAESEMGLMQARGAASAAFSHDASLYFDLHHTPDDTLDKIDPKALKQNTAAYAAVALMAANAEGSLGSGPEIAKPER